MSERTGGSVTVKDGKIIDRIDPPKTHPEGNRARRADGQPWEGAVEQAAPVAPVAVPAAAKSAAKSTPR